MTRLKGFGNHWVRLTSPDMLEHRLAELSEHLDSGLSFQEPIPTGSLMLDYATGSGGLPRGQIVTVTGGAGDSEALALTTVAQVQKNAGSVVVVDLMGRLSRRLRQHPGIDFDRLLVVRPDDPRQAVSSLLTLVQLEPVDLLIVGSLFASPTKAGTVPALPEEIVNQLSELSRAVASSHTCVLFVEPSPRRRGQSETTTVRRMLSDLGSLQLETRYATGVRPAPAEGSPGRLLQVDLAGEGTARPLATLAFDDLGRISRVDDLLYSGLAENLLKRHKSRYHFGQILLGEDLEEVRKALLGAPNLSRTLESTLRGNLAEIRQRAAAEPAAQAAPERGLPLEASAKDQPPNRYVNTWFEGEEPLLPLAVGRRYAFHVQIGPRRSTPGLEPAPFVEPDWGNREAVDLLITLYSDDFLIENRHHAFMLPRSEASEVLTSYLTPKHAGDCRVRIIVSLARELEVLQELAVAVEAVETPVLTGRGD
ncbi:MAG TPA: hypothetical protein VGG03_24065 [Thermoanaerobaculia bacterium]|jgi:recombination protein RecA